LYSGAAIYIYYDGPNQVHAESTIRDNWGKFLLQIWNDNNAEPREKYICRVQAFRYQEECL